MEKEVTIEVYEAKRTGAQLTLVINGKRIAGLKSGYGYDLITSWKVKKEDILKVINEVEKCQ